MRIVSTSSQVTASQVISSLLLLHFSSDLRGIELLSMLRFDLAISTLKCRGFINFFLKLFPLIVWNAPDEFAML